MTLSGGAFYGTASQGGDSGDGMIFAANADGSSYTSLYEFSALDANGYNNDGAQPWAGLAASGGTLYGAALYGGPAGNGVLFAAADGLSYTVIHAFSALDTNGGNSDGANPAATLLLSGGTLYGTAMAGGSSSVGAVFAVQTDGTGFTNLHNAGATGDGYNPQCQLVLSGNTLYGTMSRGGAFSSGMVFAMNTDGSGYRTLHDFTSVNNSGVNGDGANPMAGLALSGDTLYGTASVGGLE